MTPLRRFYGTDLAYVHEAGFRDYAERAAPEIVALLRARGIVRGRIVEFGCGGGTVAAELADAGYEVLGIDISPAMIRLARAKAPGASFRVGSLGDTRIPPCVAIVAVGEVVSYITAPRATLSSFRQHDRQLLAFFVRARGALAPEGVLLFDFIETAAGRTYPSKTMAGDGWVVRVRAHADSAGRTLTRTITTARKVDVGYRRSYETHRARIYSREQMKGLLQQAGFRALLRRSIGRVRLMRGDVVVVAEPPFPRDTPIAKRIAHRSR
jgi:SAM-dependent methyltransferase